MAFTVATRTSDTTVADTSHTVTLPDGSDVSGVRVVVLFGAPTSEITWPTGWTEFFEASTTDATVGAAYRDIDGTEGFDGTDDTISVTTAESVLANHHSYLISAGHDSGTAPEAATAATGNGANADPPSLNPAGWDTEEALWIAAAGYRFNTSFTAAPTDYTGLLSLSGGDDNTPLGSARRVLSAASEDPGAFTSGDGSQWVATTVAVRPAAGGAVTGSAAGSYSFTGAATGTPTTTAVAAGSFSFTGAATGTATVVAAASSTFTFTGAATGTPTTTGTAAGSFTYTSTATGTPTVVAAATSTFTFTGAATGTTAGVVTGSAAGSFGYTGAATGTPTVVGAAAGSFGYTGAVSGTVTIIGSAPGSYTYSGAATGTGGVTADPNPFSLSHTEPAGITHRESFAISYQEPPV